MRRTTQTTWALALLLVALLAADALAWRARTLQRAPMPQLAPFGLEAAAAVSLTHGDTTVRLERLDDRWMLTHPMSHPADTEGVTALLAGLAGGLTPDARVDQGNHDQYGLDGMDPIEVDIATADQSIATVYVGNDAPGGATFIRFPGSPEVYRARVGGRARFDRPARAWRDPTLWTFDGRRLIGLTVDRDDGQHTSFTRSPSLANGQPSPWQRSDDADFPTDPALMEAMVYGLANLRAGAVFNADHPGGLTPPRATLHLLLDDGSEHEAFLGLVDDRGYIGLPDRDAVYRLPGRLVHRLVADTAAWRDHRMLDLDPTQIREVEWIHPAGRVVVVPDVTTGQWRIQEPRGLLADHRALDAAIGFLARARAEAFIHTPPSDCGLPGNDSIILTTDRAWTLQLGGPPPAGTSPRDMRCIRSPGEPDRIGVIETEMLHRLALAFQVHNG
jgi:hypothetical protein